MANTVSAKKRTLTNEVRRTRNVARRSDMKTSCKRVEEALAAKDVTRAASLLKTAESKIARARVKGVLKKRTAARKIGRLAKKIAAAVKALE